MTQPKRVILLYPERGNAFYFQLASRLAEACRDLSSEVRLISAAELGSVDEGSFRDAITLVVCPAECLLSGDGALKRLHGAARVVAVAAEAVKTSWYTSQYDALPRVDAFCDVGFVDQRPWNPIDDVPYHFVFNAGLEAERHRLKSLSPSARPLTWALVAHMTPDRARLGNELLTRLGPQGFLFLPTLRPVRRGEGMLGPTALHRVLQRASCYVWQSHHTYPYYESFRFLDAILAGAVPCKIESSPDQDLLSVPNVFPSVQQLAQVLERRSPLSLFEESRSFYLDQGSLTSHLSEFFSNV